MTTADEFAIREALVAEALVFTLVEGQRHVVSYSQRNTFRPDWQLDVYAHGPSLHLHASEVVDSWQMTVESHTYVLDAAQREQLARLVERLPDAVPYEENVRDGSSHRLVAHEAGHEIVWEYATGDLGTAGELIELLFSRMGRSSHLD